MNVPYLIGLGSCVLACVGAIGFQRAGAVRFRMGIDREADLASTYVGHFKVAVKSHLLGLFLVPFSDLGVPYDWHVLAGAHLAIPVLLRRPFQYLGFMHARYAAVDAETQRLESTGLTRTEAKDAAEAFIEQLLLRQE